MISSVMIIVKHLIYGGTEKYTFNLANALADQGISVTLMTSGGPLTASISSDVKVFIAPISRKFRIKQITEKKILEIAQIYRPQVIHTQCRTSLVCAQLARNCLNIPLVTHEHHMYNKSDYPFIINELEMGADKIITAGPYAARALLKNGMAKDKVITILNGVDINKIPPVTNEERKAARQSFNLQELDKVVVCLSRLEPGKGIDKLARGFVKVARKIPEAKLVIAGDDQWNLVKPFLKEIASKHNLQNRLLVFPGEYDIRKYHAIADVFCYPAIAKGMAVMEAMAAGLPVVGKKTVKKPLVVEDGVSGLMTESTSLYKIDPDQIAKKLIFLLQRPELGRKMGEAARIRIESKYNFEKTVNKIVKVYQELTQPHHLSGQEQFAFLYPDS